MEELRPHQALRSLLDELPVRCKQGCGWSGRRDKRPGHEAFCPVTKLMRLKADLAERDARIAELKRSNKAQRKALEAHDSGRDQRLADGDARIACLEARTRAQDA